MSLFTFIMDFRGGTYISQVSAVSLKVARKKWISSLNVDQIKYFSERTIQKLDKQSSRDEFVLIEGMENVWLSCFRVKGGFVSIHVIKTSK